MHVYVSSIRDKPQSLQNQPPVCTKQEKPYLKVRKLIAVDQHFSYTSTINYVLGTIKLFTFSRFLKPSFILKRPQTPRPLRSPGNPC